MDVMSVGRRSARKMAAQCYLLERARQEIVAATARLFQPRAFSSRLELSFDRQRSLHDAAGAGRVGKEP
jgi:hypothetical protein